MKEMMVTLALAMKVTLAAMMVTLALAMIHVQQNPALKVRVTLALVMAKLKVRVRR
jgi:hypothetical protein